MAHGNLADPGYEPTDEELSELSRSAFATVAARNAAALSRVHAEIATLRAALAKPHDRPPTAEPSE